MTYKIFIKPNLKKLLEKKKYKHNADIIYSKMKDIANVLETNPNHYKNLTNDFKEFKRVHCNSFVLIFSVDHENKRVCFHELTHHDEAYNPKNLK